MSDPKIEDMLKQVCEYLGTAGVEYVIVGGIAVLAYGTPRTTMDADIIIRMDERALGTFIEMLRKDDYFANIDDARTALNEHSHFTIEHRISLFRLDLKGVYNEMDRRALARRQKVIFRGTELFLESPEDLIANKLVFGSPQDLHDAQSVFIRQREILDMDYLEYACKENGVEEEYHQLRRRLDGEINRNSIVH